MSLAYNEDFSKFYTTHWFHSRRSYAVDQKIREIFRVDLCSDRVELRNPYLVRPRTTRLVMYR
jgi:hypothetical protein